MSEYNEFPMDYEEVNDEKFLFEIPIELMQQVITDQFTYPYESRKVDYVKSFIDKYEFSKENQPEDEQGYVEDYRDSFISFMVNTFEKFFGIGFPEIENMSDDEGNELIHMTYRFFIRNMKKNFVHLVYHHIDNDLSDIASRFDNRKDVTSLNFREELDNEDEIIILSNLRTIIREYLNDVYENYTIDQFFDSVDYGELSIEYDYVKNAFDNFYITGNFVPNYINFAKRDLIDELETKVRNHILKKYPKRIRKNIEDVIEDDIEEQDGINGNIE